MTAAHVTRAEAAALVALLTREAKRAASRSREDDPLAPLLESALYGPQRAFLSRPGKEFRARLCERAFAIAGGKPGTLPVELPLSIEILHAGSLIVDDIEDDSERRRGAPALHRQVGMPVALNAGNWLYFWPQRLIAGSGLAGRARLEAHERMGECLLRCHEGQALDLTVSIDRLARDTVPAVVRGVSERKTGGLMGLAAAFGAIAAGASDEHVCALERFGCQLGVGLQMLDDLGGLLNPQRSDKGMEDLTHRRATWAWAWLAEDLDAPEYAAVLSMLGRASEPRGRGDGRAIDALLEQLRFRLGVTGLRRARCQLERTVDQLVVECDANDFRRELERELHRLERGFIEGAP